MPEEITNEAPPAKDTTDASPILEFDDVSIGFDGKPVLSNISFKVARGETLIILGPAGCGKSVLMKMADGLLDPDSGKILVYGEDLSTMRESERLAFRKRIGIVFQESALFDSLSVEDNVAYLLHEERKPEDEVHNRVVEALKFVELSEAIKKFPAELSGGMRRRVSIARAIITGPDLILYDSATGGLDPITSTTIIELIVKQRDVSHTTALLITHRMQDAFTLATHKWNPEAGHMELIPNGGIDDSTRFIVINECHIVFDGSTRELVHTEDPWLKAYLA